MGDLDSKTKSQQDQEETMVEAEDEITEADSLPEAEQQSESEEGQLEALKERIAQAESKAQEHWDQLLRSKAEMENLRRRSERDLENAHKYSLERFALELLPVKDSLELGLSAAADQVDEHAEKLREGTELTLKMLTAAMEKFSIKEIDPQDEPFDPELHQAMTLQESTSKAPNTVLSVMQKGYILNERLIRPAMVIVSKEATTGADGDNEANTNIDKQT